MSQHLINYTTCPACGSQNIFFALQAKDYTVSGETYDIYECGNCSLRFTQQVPGIEDIGRYYKSEQYISHTNTNKGIINKLYHFVRQRTLKQKVRIVQEATGLKQGSLLDVGAGVGAFAAEVKKHGWQADALEPDADARDITQQTYGIKAQPSQELFNLPQNTYDAITLWHVLEHVHELQKYMATFYELLKVAGVLIVAVPNYTSYDAQKYGAYWAAYDVPRHLYHFSPRSMQMLVQRHRMEVVQMLPMRYDSYYVSMLSEQYRHQRQHYLQAFMSGYRSNSAAGAKPEKFSSVIYIIRKKT